MIRLLSNPLPPAPLLVMVPLLALLSGCNKGEQRPEVHPVAGQLTVNGQPAEGALLSFHPADGVNFDQRGSRPRATVEADGSFTVSTYGDGDGAPAGEYAVSVVWIENPESATPVDKLDGRFADPEQSEWRVRIEEGENQLEPYRIEGVRLPRNQRSARRSDSVDPEE